MKRYIYLTLEVAKCYLLSAMEKRISFILQIVGMVINDTFMIIVWYLFSLRYPLINGWAFTDTAMLYAISTMSFSLWGLFFINTQLLSKKIINGELDKYLVYPTNTLWHISLGSDRIDVWGDLIFSLIIFIFIGNFSLHIIGLYLILSILGAVVYFSFTIIVHSITFWVGNFEDAADQMFHALLGFTLYPQSTFHGALKIIMMTIIPAFFIATLPVQLIKDFDLVWFLILVCFTILIFIFSIITFYSGLKKYESGNLISI